ncbi:MAG: MvaI/BcnI family restriction endonuclease, partial [Gammaproteobacteria bacterium]|nr:MvaI/BcnI family restriction endonuclease [Gammaproteobacteria bacterium]
MIAISDADFFARLRGIMDRGWIQIPDCPGYQGSGGPGLLLEELIGIDPNNRDGPDTGIWELKYHGGSAPITLFHLTPKPKGNMHQVVRGYGWPDSQGRTSFRHTIWGTSPRGFRVVNDVNRVTVRNDFENADSDIIPPYWTHDSLINAFVYKLRRLAVVNGKKRNGQVRYFTARLYWEPNVTQFIDAIARGVIAIDFDA